MSRIAALDGGTYFHHFTLTDPAFAPFFDRVLPLRNFTADDLTDVDTLFVSCRANPELLEAKADVLQGFLRAGKRLVAMGETYPERWLPGITFASVETNFWWWLEPGADSGLRVDSPEHPMFDHFGLRDATWHYHGQFSPPPGASSLISCREGGSILYEDTISWPGTLIVTSLDPCYHHGSFFMPNATRFLGGLLRYLTSDHKGNSS